MKGVSVLKDKKTFGLFIKQKRIEKNYSQKDLASILGVTQSCVSCWEQGKCLPSMESFIDFLDLFGCWNLRDIFYYDKI